MPTLARAELQAAVERFNDIQRLRDPTALAAFHTLDGVVDSPMYGVRSGRKAIEEAYRAFITSFPDYQVTIDATVIEPPHMSVFTTITATHVNEFFGLSGTGRRIQIRMARLIEMTDDLIAYERRIYDFTGLLVQVGVLRAKPAKP